MRQRNDALPSVALPPKREIRFVASGAVRKSNRRASRENARNSRRGRVGVAERKARPVLQLISLRFTETEESMGESTRRWKSPRRNQAGEYRAVPRVRSRYSRERESTERKFRIRKQQERNVSHARCDKSTMRASCFKARCTLARPDTLAFAYMQRTAAHVSPFGGTYVDKRTKRHSVTRDTRRGEYTCARCGWAIRARIAACDPRYGNVTESRARSRRRC